jgi:O-antigen/teichoic acid export membrane protein
MNSIAGRTAILGISRIANKGLTFLTPLFLVRFLSVEQFGEYREFLLYVSVLGPFASFYINNSLLYFVPRAIEQHRRYVTQAVLMTLGTSIAAILLAAALAQFVAPFADRNLVFSVLGYVFFATNFDFWESYWLARKQSFNVLIYSTGVLTVRALTVILTAYLAKDVAMMIAALVIIELCRLVIFGGVAYRLGLLSAKIDRSSFKEQARFIFPVGIAGLLVMVNGYVGQLFVSYSLGAAILAYYVVGTTLQPVITIFRNTIADIVLPETMSGTHDSTETSLSLWQKSSVFSCLVLIPIVVVASCISDPLITTLFTDAYRPAVPIFEIYLLILVRECFDFGVPLRIAARTSKFVTGNLIALFVNLPLILILADTFGVLAPAIAFVVARFFNGFYLCYSVTRAFEVDFKNLLPWSEILKVFLASGLAGVTYLLIGFSDAMTIEKIVFFLVLYAVVYLLAIWSLNVSIVRTILVSIRQKIFVG